MSKPLSERQRRFVEAYMGKARGNASEAARLAGYKTPAVQGSRLLTKDNVLNEIARRAREDPEVMDREAMQRMLTKVAQDGKEATRDRLGAVKLLGQSQGMFVNRLEHSGHVDATVKAVLESSPEDTEDRVVEALRADPELWARIRARVEESIADRESWDASIPRIGPTEGEG